MMRERPCERINAIQASTPCRTFLQGVRQRLERAGEADLWGLLVEGQFYVSQVAVQVF